jgi:DNA-binding NarL/FixJ family response regulator
MVTGGDDAVAQTRQRWIGHPDVLFQGETMELTTPMSRAAGFPGDVLAFKRRTAPARVAIRLLLAHGDGLARAGLRALLERDGAVTVVGEVSRGDDVIALARELRPDVVLMGLQLPGLDGLQATRLLVAGGAGTQVVLLGGCGSDEELFGALRAGASGFLVNETRPAELLQAIRSVSEGHAVLSPSVTRRLIDELASHPDRHRPIPERLEELTTREREVMGLVAMGLTNHEIAERLVVSPATAKTHVSRAMLKLHARDRAQLVVLAYQTRLVEPRATGDHSAPSPLLAAA